MYRREALVALGGWDASSCCEDYDLWLRSLGRYGPPGFVDEVVALYRKEQVLGGESIRSGAHARNQLSLQRRHASLRPAPTLLANRED